uniref:Glutathione peroxidase n=1 Tax=Oreochromis niloticus TaxID=8128 RepID=A0A669B1I9_ORENI
QIITPKSKDPYLCLICTFLIAVGCLLLLTTTCFVYKTSMANKSVYDFSAETLDGQPVPLSNYRGKVLLIVNVATF